MKKRIMKIRTIFKSNFWLTAASLIIVITVLLLLWKWSLQAAGSYVRPNSVNALLEERPEAEEEETVVTDDNSLKVVRITFAEDKTFLSDGRGNIVFGPCEFIFDDFSYSNHNRIFRYVDSSSGLIGFGQVNDDCVTILFPAVLSQASKMTDGSACVQEDGHYYFIDYDGKRFTKDYMNAYPFAEAQGSYARVQTEDGGWAIINRKDEIVIGGFDSINELHYLSLVGSGIKDGKAVLFSLEDFDGRQPGIIKEFSDYTEIDEPFEGSDIAIVTEKKKGKKGVLCIWNGELVVPSSYEEIQWGVVDTEETENDTRKLRWFCCLKEDGSYDVKYWRF